MLKLTTYIGTLVIAYILASEHQSGSLAFTVFTCAVGWMMLIHGKLEAIESKLRS